ncbi:PAS domain S-box protein [Noviherbaspirillum suwonense]|uniref:histidine kinase n=1 Tax=Noviherbaspirillum suwonense TaxID=1224511 RepID=A0ABY1PYP9_9BURK|nr:PAS domain S-box protein [Noviherbaspirillum suwonense]SMP51514.1 PAS domain S-box-containing protein [Noviherbaspirillum suwonense]
MIEPPRKPDIAPAFDALPGPYALLAADADFAVVAVSDKLLQNMRRSRQAVLGQPVLSLFGSGDGTRAMRNSLETVLSSRETDCIPATRLDLSGTGGHGEAQYWVFCNTPVFDQAAQLTGILLHVENVNRQLHPGAHRPAEEALNRQILDSARDFAIFGTDLDGRVTFWNEGASRVLGWSEAEMLGRESACIFTPEDVAQGLQAVEMRTALGHGQASGERWHVRRDGRRIWASGQLTQLTSAAGAPVGFVRILRDQTEQHLTAQALRESRHRLDSALDTGLVGFFEWDVVDGQVFGDERFAAMFGMAPLQARQGLTLPDLIALVHADDRQGLRRSLDTALETHADTTREFRVAAPDGSIGWVLMRARCYLQQHDKPLRYTGAAIDVSASKLAEAQVRKLNARLAALVQERTSALHMREAQMRAIFESSHQFQCLLSTDGIVLDANPVSLDAIGSRLPDVAGQPFHDTPWVARSGAARDVIRASLDQAAAGQTARRELTLELPDGKRHYDFAIRPVHGRDRTVIGIIAEATDTTGRRRAEEQLRQSQKMEAIGQLTGGIAHDFNNLLAGIIGSLDLMRHKFSAGQTQDHARYIDMATASAQRAATLTQRLLAFSRRQTLDLKAVDVNELVTGMADLLNRTLNKNIELTFRLAPDLAPAWTDANQLENALLNLAINARDAMTDGGKLTITTRNVTLDQAYASSRPELEAGAYLMLSVSDTGSGMTPDVIAKAFDPFFTTKPIGQGTGLGLSMIYGYVKQARGHVTIHSQPGLGSTITLYLPRHRSGMPDLDEQLPEAALPAGRGQRILVVEDETAMRAILVETLNGLGYRTGHAGDAAAALAAIDAGDAPDLLITDVGLPGLNGLQLAAQVRLRWPGTRVLFITGYAGPIARADFTGEGMDMIGKPFALDAFAVKVRDMLSE